MTTQQLARQLLAIKTETEYLAALLAAGARETAAAMCATEARVEGFTGKLCQSHAAYCLDDRGALARDAGHAVRELRHAGRPTMGAGKRERVTITVDPATAKRWRELAREAGKSLGQMIDLWVGDKSSTPKN
jgi:hypothetical protein